MNWKIVTEKGRSYLCCVISLRKFISRIIMAGLPASLIFLFLRASRSLKHHNLLHNWLEEEESRWRIYLASSSDTFGSKYHIYLNNIKIKIISLIIFIQAYLLSNRIFPSDPIYTGATRLEWWNWGKYYQTQTAIGLKLN